MIIYRGANIILDLGFNPDGKEIRDLTSHSVEFSFESADYIKLEKGDSISFNGKDFFLNKNYIPEINKNTNGYKYDLKFFDITERFKDFILKYSLQGVDETEFKLTNSGDKFLDVVIYTLQKHNIGLFTKGQYPTETAEIHFNNTDVFSGLSQIAEAYECEWWLDGSVLNLGKLEYGMPIPLRYDTELDDISLSPSSEKLITRLYSFGGTRNIPNNYRVTSGAVDNIAERKLRLPEGTNYIDLFPGLPENQIIEGVKVFEDIFPKQVNTIISIEEKLYAGNGADTQDTTAYIIKGDNTFVITKEDIQAGQALKIAFMSGNLNGREFDLIIREDNKFEIKYIQEGNICIPNATLKPNIGDTFFFFNFKADVVLPTLITQAENDLLAHAQSYIDKIGSEYVFDVKTRSIYCEENNIDLPLGQIVTLQSEAFGIITSRIQAYEKDLYNKYEAVYQVGDYSKYSRLSDIESRIKDPQAAFNSLKLSIETVFKDGIITGTELEILKERLAHFSREKASIDKTFNIVYSDAFLTGAAKDNLQLSKENFDAAFFDLTNTINSVVADGVVTDAEEAEITTLMDNYSAAYADYKEQEQLAQKSITDAINSELSNQYLSKVKPDTAQKLITFLEGIELGEYIPGMFGGKGARIDALGNMEATSLRLRALLEVPELRHNRLTVIGDEIILTPNGLIHTVEKLSDRSYKLNMKLEKGESIMYNAGTLIKGIFHHNTGFATSFMRVEEVGQTFMKVALAADTDVPTQYNAPPMDFMNVARIGHVTDEDKQRYMVFSTKLGGYQLYDGCSDFMNGTLVASFDTAQSFKSLYGDLPLKDGLPYVYAAGLVVQDIIRVDYNGKTVRTINDRGLWQDGVTYYNNDTNGTDDVWHLGCRWRCFSSNTTEEPSWTSAAWYMIEGRSDARMEFDSSNGYAFFAGRVDTVITPIVLIGNTDVSTDIVEEQWIWERESGDAAADLVWNTEQVPGRVLHITDEDMGTRWSRTNPVTFRCTATYPASSINQVTNYLRI